MDATSNKKPSVFHQVGMTKNLSTSLANKKKPISFKRFEFIWKLRDFKLPTFPIIIRCPGSCIETEPVAFCRPPKMPHRFFWLWWPTNKVEMIYAFMLNFVTLCAARLSWFGCYVKTVLKTMKNIRGWVFFCEAPRKLGRHRWFLLILKPKMMEVAEFHQVCHLKWQTWFMVAIDSFSKNKFCLKIYAAYFMFWHVLISFFFFLNLSLLTCGDSLCKLPVPVRSPARGTIPRTSRTSFNVVDPSAANVFLWILPIGWLAQLHRWTLSWSDFQLRLGDV